MNSKKIASSVVALALGASALVAPRAAALPADFVSPPSNNSNPEQSQCNVTLQQNTSTSQVGDATETTRNGITVGAATEDATVNGVQKHVFRPWIEVSSTGERIVNSATATIGISNFSKNDNTLSYTVSPSKKEAVDIKGTDTVLDVTDLAVTNPKAVNVRAGQTNGKSVTAELGVDLNSDRQLWAWEIPAPSTKANEQSRITPIVDAEVAPWTIENDNCLPLVPSATTSKPIIADGTEYSTGITVANAEKDYQRLTGTVSIGGKTIKDAKVRVDASGKVYVTLPKGATGAVDNDKPVKVDVELSA